MVPAAQTPRFRSVLEGFTPYKPGRVTTSPDGRSFRLASNESPFGPLPSVLDVIATAAADAHRYPDNGAQALIAAIGARFGVPEAHIAVGCGSVGVTQQLLGAVAEPGFQLLQLAVGAVGPVMQQQDPARPSSDSEPDGVLGRRMAEDLDGVDRVAHVVEEHVGGVEVDLDIGHLQLVERQAEEQGGLFSCPVYPKRAGYFRSFPDPVLNPC